MHVSANVGGLAFLNPANHIGQRTSYDVFGDSQPTFAHTLSVSFDMQLPYNEEVGYVLRVIDTTSDNIYNVFFDGRGDDYFELNREGFKNILKYHYNQRALRQKQWFRMEIEFNLDRKTASLCVDGHKSVASVPGLPDRLNPQIIFGRSDYLIDVP